MSAQEWLMRQDNIVKGDLSNSLFNQGKQRLKENVIPS